MTYEEIIDLIDANYPNNTTGLITPALEREVLKAIVTYIQQHDGGGGGEGIDNFAGYYANKAALVAANVGASGKYALTGSGNSLIEWNWDPVISDWVPNMTKLSSEDFYIDENGEVRIIPKDAAGGSDPFILNPGRLSILSPTSASLQNARWRHADGIFEFSGNLTLPAKPTDPNNRFDIVVFGNGSLPIVQTGTGAPDPVVPNPNAGTMLAHTIYRPHDGEDIVITTPASYATKVQLGQWAPDGLTHLYAPIWKQTVSTNTYYGFNLAFLHWCSDYSTFGQRPKNGFLFVSFVTGATNTQIDPTRVVFETTDVSPNNGDFVMVQSGADEVTIFAKKGTYLGNLTYDYVGPKWATVRDDSLQNNQPYDILPPIGTPPLGARYFSTNGVDYVPSTGTTIRFDKPRVYGPLTGNLTISTAYANAGYMAEVVHNSVTEPAISVPSGVTLVKLAGEYISSSNNIYLFVCRKGGDTTTKDGNNVTSVWYTISQNQL